MEELSRIVSTEVVCPDDTNPMNMLKGGRLLQWMDNAAAICAQTFAGTICVTVGIRDIRFLRPAGVGDMITISAVVTETFNTSLTIDVEVSSRRVGEEESQLITTGSFSFVSIGADGKPAPLKKKVAGTLHKK